MRARMTLALGVSALLIGGAVFTRAEGKKAHSADLYAIDNSGNVTINADDAANAELTDSLADLNGPTSTSTASSTDLTDADLISRQMFSDYLNMAMTGQNDAANLSALGTTYANSISDLNKASSISTTDVVEIPDTKENLNGYATSFVNIVGKYQGLLATTLSQSHVTSIGPEYSALAASLGGLYQREADEFKALPVPTSVLDDHVKLVNIYLSDAWAMTAISKQDADPASAFAGMVAENANTDDEKTTLQKIATTLTDNGI